MNEKANQLMSEAQDALKAKYYDKGFALFKQAIEIYKNNQDTEAANHCEATLQEVIEKYRRCAPFPAIDHHAHPLFRSALEKDPSLYMAAKHFRMRPEAFPEDIDHMVRHMDDANIDKAIIIRIQGSCQCHNCSGIYYLGIYEEPIIVSDLYNLSRFQIHCEKLAG